MAGNNFAQKMGGEQQFQQLDLSGKLIIKVIFCATLLQFYDSFILQS